MRFFRELDPFASYVAVAALAIATWVFLIVPLWRRWRPSFLLLSKNNLLKKRWQPRPLYFSCLRWACGRGGTRMQYPLACRAGIASSRGLSHLRHHHPVL